MALKKVPILLLLVCVERIFCVARIFGKNQVFTILTDQDFSNIDDCVNNGFCGGQGGGGGGGGGGSCFSLNSYVRMFDSSVKRITDIKSGDLVLSTDSNGNIDSTEVITIMHYGDVLGNPKYFIIINYILIIIFLI